MATIPSIKTWSLGEDLTSADLNGNFATIRDALVARGLFTDEARTVTAVQTFSAAPVFTNAQTFAAGVTVTTGGLTVTAGGLTVTAGASSFGADVGVTGTVTATTFAGSGASLTNLPAANLTGTLGAVSGANLTNLNGSNVTTGTVAQAQLPTTYTVLRSSGGVTLSDTGGSPQNALSVSSNYVQTGASTPTALASAPATGSGWAYVRIATNLGDGWLPVLLS